MTGSSAGISSRSTQRASRREGRGFATRYHVPIVATRTIRSAKPAATNNDAASDRNSFEVGKESAVLRIPSVLRITSNIPATANNRGQSAFTWLTISHLIETLPKRVARISESVLRGCRFPLNHTAYRRPVSGGRDGQRRIVIICFDSTSVQLPGGPVLGQCSTMPCAMARRG